MKISDFSNRNQRRRFLITLQGTICFFSLFLITPLARGEEKPAQNVDYESVFNFYDNWEWEETSDWLKANHIVNEIGGWQFYSREDSEKTQ